MRRRLLVTTALLLAPAPAVLAQTVSQRGFADAMLTLYPQAAPNDATQSVADVVAREEVFFKPRAWVQFAAGLELRANSHDQVDKRWTPDFWDRDERRPPVSIRRLSATLHQGVFTFDLGKQFIRWGRTDIVHPTDRFAPRDFMSVIDADFLGTTGVHGLAELGRHTLEAVWVPRFTPSRIPLIDQRWSAVPPAAARLPIAETASVFPGGSQFGVRWGHTADRLEYSLSFFDGFNSAPDILSTVRYATEPPVRPTAVEVTRVYPPIRTYGGDMAWPLRWFTVKTEAAYFTSSSASTDAYVLYVLQLERQSGEWVFVGGYAGEAVTRRRAALTFSPERGMSRSSVGRVSYTIDTNRSAAFEGALRQDGRGAYGRAEYSQAQGQHWRATIAFVALRGQSDDFFGQYRRNSNVTVRLRYSF